MPSEDPKAVLTCTDLNNLDIPSVILRFSEVQSFVFSRPEHSVNID